MARLKFDLRGDAYRKVLGFLMGHWAHQPGRVLAMFALFMLATVADVLTPLYAGNLVTAVTNGVSADGKTKLKSPSGSMSTAEAISVVNSGLALANPTNLSVPSWDPAANPRQFQSYSHYVMPGGLVESFIDNVDGRRGGTLAPTVKLNFKGGVSQVDRSFGRNGLGPYGFIPSNIQAGGNGHY